MALRRTLRRAATAVADPPPVPPPAPEYVPPVPVQIFQIGQRFWGGQGGPNALNDARQAVIALKPSGADLHQAYADLPSPPSGSPTQTRVSRFAYVVFRLAEAKG